MIGVKKAHTLAKGIDGLLMFVVDYAHYENLIIFYGKKHTDTVEMNPQTRRWRQTISRWSPNSQVEATAPLVPFPTTLIKKTTWSR